MSESSSTIRIRAGIATILPIVITLTHFEVRRRARKCKHQENPQRNPPSPLALRLVWSAVTSSASKRRGTWRIFVTGGEFMREFLAAILTVIAMGVLLIAY